MPIHCCNRHQGEPRSSNSSHCHRSLTDIWYAPCVYAYIYELRACQLVLFLHALCLNFYWLWFELNVIKWCFRSLLWVLCHPNHCSKEVPTLTKTYEWCITEIGLCAPELISKCHLTKEHTKKSSNRTKQMQHCCSNSVNHKQRQTTNPHKFCAIFR